MQLAVVRMIQHHNLWPLVLGVAVVNGHASVQTAIFQLRCVQLCSTQIREMVNISLIRSDSEHKYETSATVND